MLFRTLVFLYLWVSSLNSNLKAFECSPENRYQQKLHRLERSGRTREGFIKLDQHLIETRDQDSVGYCYGYVAADILEYWLRRKGHLPNHEHISAMAMGLTQQIDSWDLLMRELIGLERQNQQIRDQNLTAKSLIRAKSDLKEFAPSRLPWGGMVGSAIESYQNFPICFESEVNSRDSAIVDYYQTYRDLYSSDYFQPSSFNGALAAIETLRQGNPEQICKSFELARQIFVQLPFATVSGYSDLIAASAQDSSIFAELIKKGCSQKELQLYLNANPPIIWEELYSEKLTREANRNNFENLVEQSLTNEMIASISYNSAILKGLNGREGENHVSVIVGSSKLCDQEYYILRNSWGQEACQSDYENFNFHSHPDVVVLRTAKVKCNARSIEGEDCRALYEDAYAQLDLKPPFFCDEQGNYIIEKDYLLKHALSATTLLDSPDLSPDV